MKAAVLHEVGGVPRYQDFPDPVPGPGEVLIEVRAVAVENVDRLIAAGRHFAGHDFLAALPAIPCFDGIGALPDGTLVGFGNTTPPYGALAELTVVGENSVVPAPAGIDPAVAVVLSSAVPGMAITTAAGFVPGETVLIQGATGVAGRLAVQVARLLGAGRVVATGRDDEALRALGADHTINTDVPDDHLRQAFQDARGEGYDVILDFLWGRPTSLLLESLVPAGFGFPRPTRLIQAGESAAPTLPLPAAGLRTSGVEIYGVARNLTLESITTAYAQVADWARAGELTVAVDRVPLSDIETAWPRTTRHGHRLVVTPA